MNNTADDAAPLAEVDFAQLQAAACQASQLLRALANEYRLLILCHLMEGEKQVAELKQLIDLSQSALSQHLGRLRQEGLVRTRRESQAIFYSLAGTEVRQVMAVLYDLYCRPAKQRRGRYRSRH